MLPLSQQSTLVLSSLAFDDYEGIALHAEEKLRLPFGVDSPAEKRLSRAPSTGYPWSPGRFHRSRNHSDAADSSGPARRAA